KLAELAIRPSKSLSGAMRAPAGGIRVRDADPRRLGVHAAISVPGVSDEVLPEYVPRDVDDAEFGVRARVKAAVQRGGVLLLVGGLAPAPAPRTVVWLDELQRYLYGEHGVTGGTVRALLNAPHPAVIIGTLWPDRYEAYTVVPTPGDADPRAREREVLDLADI